MASKGSEHSLDDLPNEVLEVIFDHMNSTSLRCMTQVSTGCREQAKKSFERKYSGENEDKFFTLKICAKNSIEDMKIYLPFFRAFGENMQAIDITVQQFDGDMEKCHWVCDFMLKYCKRLKKLKAEAVSLSHTMRILQQLPITHIEFVNTLHSDYEWMNYTYTNLISVKFVGDYDEKFPGNELNKFLTRNKQLKEFCCNNDLDSDSNILDMINGKMNELITIELCSLSFGVAFPELKSTIIMLAKLESIILGGQYTTLPILQAICKGCPNITRLDISKWKGAWNDNVIQAVCSLKELTSLIIIGSDGIQVDHIQRLVNSLPRLSVLCLNASRDIGVNASIFMESLPCIVTFCGKLSKLEIINSGWVELPNLSVQLLAPIAESTLGNQLKITVSWYHRGYKIQQLTIDQGQVRLGNSFIYWDGYDRAQRPSTHNFVDLGDSCLKLIVSYLDARGHAALYNTCKKTREIVKDQISKHVFYLSKFHEVDFFELLESIFRS